MFEAISSSRTRTIIPTAAITFIRFTARSSTMGTSAAPISGSSSMGNAQPVNPPTVKITPAVSRRNASTNSRAVISMMPLCVSDNTAG